MVASIPGGRKVRIRGCVVSFVDNVVVKGVVFGIHSDKELGDFALKDSFAVTDRKKYPLREDWDVQCCVFSVRGQ